MPKVDDVPVQWRPPHDVVYSSLWPTQGISPDPGESRRHLAVLEVLSRIPPDVFAALEDKSDDFHWYIPHYQALGEVYPFPITHNQEPAIEGETLGRKARTHVLYLSPRLEDTAWDIVVAVVAHELTHIVLAHNLRPGDDVEYSRQEEEVFAQLRVWGFEREAKSGFRTVIVTSTAIGLTETRERLLRPW